jgi:hypothetical protein
MGNVIVPCKAKRRGGAGLVLAADGFDHADLIYANPPPPGMAVADAAGAAGITSPAG